MKGKIENDIYYEATADILLKLLHLYFTVCYE